MPRRGRFGIDGKEAEAAKEEEGELSVGSVTARNHPSKAAWAWYTVRIAKVCSFGRLVSQCRAAISESTFEVSSNRSASEQKQR